MANSGEQRAHLSHHHRESRDRTQLPDLSRFQTQGLLMEQKPGDLGVRGPITATLPSSPPVTSLVPPETEVPPAVKSKRYSGLSEG